MERPIHVARAEADDYAILIDQHGKLHWKGPETCGAPIIMVLGRDVPDTHLAELTADSLSYIFSQDLAHVIDVLGDRFGIRALILEGGASTNAVFLEARLVDEISLVLFPAIGGREGGRTLFEAGPEGLADHVRLSMLSTEVRSGGAVHLRYRVSYT